VNSNVAAKLFILSSSRCVMEVAEKRMVFVRAELTIMKREEI